MPAITRSQKKVNAISMSIVEKPSANQVTAKCKYESVDKMPAGMDAIKTRFIKYVHNAITQSENYNRSISYFDNLRLITELYYYIYESVDSLLIIDGLVCTPCFQRLINIMYTKSIKFLEEFDIITKVTTAEENHIVNCFLQQMWETQEKLYPYVTDERKTKTERPAVRMFQPLKRKRSVTDYTGMDAIEPLNEYDAITNIWADTTIYEDPDYEYETDESDEEAEEDEDAIFEEAYLDEESFVVERVSSNHIRFVY